MTKIQNPDWTRHYRDDKGVWEDICKHGIGHEKGVHGCDGCCSELRKSNSKWDQKKAKELGSRGGFVAKMTRGCSPDYKRGFSTAYSFTENKLKEQKEKVKKWGMDHCCDFNFDYEKMKTRHKSYIALDEFLEFVNKL